MQDTTCGGANPNNPQVNNNSNSATLPLPDAAIISRFEESLRLRLNLFALDVHDNLKYSLQTETDDLQEQLEIQQNQLGNLINDLRLFHWLMLKRQAQTIEE